MPIHRYVATLLILTAGLCPAAYAQVYRNNGTRVDVPRDQDDRADAVMRAQQSQATAQMEAARLKVTKAYEASPEWVAARQEQKQAQEAYDAAAKPVVDALRGKPEYQAAVEEEKAAKATVAAARETSPNATPDRMAAPATQALEASSAVTKMEQDAVSTDANLVALKAKVTESAGKLQVLQQRRDATVLADPDWQAAKKQLDAARVNAAQSR